MATFVVSFSWMTFTAIVCHFPRLAVLFRSFSRFHEILTPSWWLRCSRPLFWLVLVSSKIWTLILLANSCEWSIANSLVIFIYLFIYASKLHIVTENLILKLCHNTWQSCTLFKSLYAWQFVFAMCFKSLFEPISSVVFFNNFHKLH